VSDSKKRRVYRGRVRSSYSELRDVADQAEMVSEAVRSRAVGTPHAHSIVHDTANNN